MSGFSTKQMCRVAILAAMYVPLSLFLAIHIGNVRVSFGSLPVVVAALLLGPVESVLTALIGEFIKQMWDYGITATTGLYLIPPALRGLIIGLVALRFRQRDRRLEERPMICYGVCIVAALATTVGNTLVNWLDSVLYHYYSFAYVFGDLLWRLVTGMLTAVAVATVAIPLCGLLRRQRIAGV